MIRLLFLCLCLIASSAIADDLIDTIRKDVATYPELQPLAVKILSGIEHGEPQDAFEAEWHTWAAKAKADAEHKETERRAADAKRMIEVGLKVDEAAARMRSMNVQCDFRGSYTGKLDEYGNPKCGPPHTDLTVVYHIATTQPVVDFAYKTTRVENTVVYCTACPEYPFTGRWVVSYPVATWHPDDRPGYLAGRTTITTVDVVTTYDEMCRYLSAVGDKIKDQNVK